MPEILNCDGCGLAPTDRHDAAVLEHVSALYDQRALCVFCAWPVRDEGRLRLLCTCCVGEIPGLQYCPGCGFYSNGENCRQCVPGDRPRNIFRLLFPQAPEDILELAPLLSHSPSLGVDLRGLAEALRPFDRFGSLHDNGQSRLPLFLPPQPARLVLAGVLDGPRDPAKPSLDTHPQS